MSMQTNGVTPNNYIEQYLHEGALRQDVAVSDISIDTYTTVGGFSAAIVATVSCELNNTPKCVQISHTIETDTLTDPIKLEEKLDAIIDTIEEEFSQTRTSRVVMGSTTLAFSTMDGCWSKCTSCGVRIGLEEMLQQNIWSETPMSTPSASSHFDILNTVDSLDDDTRQILQWYMLGALQKYCRCNRKL